MGGRGVVRRIEVQIRRLRVVQAAGRSVLLVLVVAACTADLGASDSSSSSTTGPPVTTTTSEATTTTVPGTTTTTRFVSAEERAWLHEELIRFVDEVAASGRVVGYTAYGEPRCMRPVVSASPSNPPGSDQTLSTARWFLGDRSERVELDSDDPASSNLNPEWEPTHWAVAIVLTYPDETWRTLPPSKLAAEVVKVEAASFAIEPVVRPEACSVIERIDVTERMLPLLPKAFEMVPTG